MMRPLLISSSIAKHGNPHATHELSPPEESPMDRAIKFDETDRTVSTDFDHDCDFDHYDDFDDSDDGDASDDSAILSPQRNPRNDPEQSLPQQEQQEEEEEHRVDEQLIRGLCNLDIRSSLSSSQRKTKTLRRKLLKQVQSLGLKQSHPLKQKQKQPSQRKFKRHARTHSGGPVFSNLRMPRRGGNRRKVTFAKPKDFSTTIEDDTPRPVEDLWYCEKDYEEMKLEALRTFHEIVTSGDDAVDRFVESDHKTARGLEATTKEMVAERRKYKIASRFVVFDEQEEQRLSRRTRDLERIRKLYGDATSKSRTIALDTARLDEEEMRLRNNGCFAEDLTNAVRIEYGWR